MPITKNEFESGRVLTELEKSVIAFLGINQNNAFTMNEIMDGINIQTNFRDLWNALLSGLFIVWFPSFLSDLAKQGKIRVNVIQGIYYYMAK